MRRFGFACLAIGLIVLPSWCRHVQGECGTTRERAGEALFQHRQMTRARHLRPLAVAPAVIANQDIGDIAVIQDANGVVDRQNQFNLDGSTLTFAPVDAAASQYHYAIRPAVVLDPATAIPLAGLDDDDSREVDLPFAFPFFGVTYRQMYVNSDGNLTFGAADNASTERSLGRMTAGPPRISPLFDDLNPSRTAGGVRMAAAANVFIVSWDAVPEYSDTNTGAPQTFKVYLYPDGTIDFVYTGLNPASAVVGIAPGGLKGSTTIVDFRTDASATYSGAVAEVFGNQVAVDIVTVAQQFYQTHDDAYDYLAIYNAMDIPALGEGAIAYEETVRNGATGFGLDAVDLGAQFGSGSRLQAVLNLGPLSQYPSDVTAYVPGRIGQQDTPITILAHESGHRFLAYASVHDGGDSASAPMLGFQRAHWSFLYDSEASLLEGERIADRGGAAKPQFLTTDITQAYSPLDQYLMGFRAAAEVPDSFVVENPTPNFVPTLHQFPGIAFDGTRRDVTMSELVKTQGRRTPDSTVAQRRFRMAFIVITAAGTQPSAADLAKLDNFRRQFESFFAAASSNHAAMDTTLKRSLKLSLSPAAGVVKGTSAAASVIVAAPVVRDLTVQFVTANGNATLPASATIPAGGTTVTVHVNGMNVGVEEVQAIPTDPAYETAFARVQVADAGMVKMTAETLPVLTAVVFVGNPGTPPPLPPPGPTPVLVKLTDANGLPYAGVGVVAVPSVNGSVIPSTVSTDAAGQARFAWNLAQGTPNQLHLALEGAPAISTTLAVTPGGPVITNVVNGASMKPGIAAGGLGALFGANLTGAKFLLNGSALPILAITPLPTFAAFAPGDYDRVDFYLPPDIPLGPATFTVIAPSGAQDTAAAEILALAPGIFPNGVRGADGGPIHAGDTIEIYCTGLGPTQPAGGLQSTVVKPAVFIGATPVTPMFSGLAPGAQGVYQVNVQLPANLGTGLQTLTLSVNNAHSDSVNFTVQ